MMRNIDFCEFFDAYVWQRFGKHWGWDIQRIKVNKSGPNDYQMFIFDEDKKIAYFSDIQQGYRANSWSGSGYSKFVLSLKPVEQNG